MCRFGLPSLQQTKTPMSFAFNIGSSDCKTYRLVSLTGDYYSVFNDLSGDEICELTANADYTIFNDFVNSRQTIKP